ncbi:MAG: histidinol dehydrogenase, partial [Bacteroidales bacterium]|nr:histidinol dehydrogenase [Bacteroidales bacterium]
MNTYNNPDRSTWEEILRRPVIDTSNLDDTVREILEHVRTGGDASVIKYTSRFDGITLDQLEANPDDIAAAKSEVSDDLKAAIDEANRNIRRFHAKQLGPNVYEETTPGVRCWQKTVPIQKVGLYIPGGSAPLLSTVLMLGIPAKLAGCEEIVLCTPPGENGKIHPGILYIADLLGINRIFSIGGVQAIAAMAYGTESVPKVNKIFGPGNQYVTAAKQLVSRDSVAIDFPAGPSELAVMADSTAVPAFVASDLLSQAEHGPDSQVVLVTDHKEMIGAVQ